MVHIGSWGLPDFGLTEKVGNFFGQGRNEQGGSQLRQGTIANVGNVPLYQAYTPQQQQVFSTGQGIKPTATANTGGQTQQQSSGGGGGGQQSAPVNWNDTSNWGFMAEGRWFQTPQDYQNFKQREAAVRQELESGYNQYEQNLGNMLSQYPEWQRQDEATLNETVLSQKQGLDQGKQAALTNLGTNKTQVENRKKESIASQAQNLRNILKASQTQLSAMGAGDSSATEKMLPYAYSKIGAKEQGNILRQANDQFAEIDKKTVDVQTQYDDQVRQVDQWKNSQLMQIRDKYQNQMVQIQQMKARVPLDKAQALASLETQLLSQAKSELAAIEASDRQFRQQLTLNAQSQLAQLQNYKAQLSQSGNFNPTDIVYQNAQALSNMGYGGGNSQNYGYVNQATAKKKYDQYGNQLY